MRRWQIRPNLRPIGRIRGSLSHHPEFGRPVTMKNEQVPVFWACGVTPQEAIANAGPPIAITHAPGHMFIADITAESTRINSSH